MKIFSFIGFGTIPSPSKFKKYYPSQCHDIKGIKNNYTSRSHKKFSQLIVQFHQNQKMNKNGFRFFPESEYFNFNYSFILIFVYKTQEIYNFYFILKNHFTVSFQIYLNSITFYDTMKNISMARRNDASINLLSNKK